MSELSEQSRQRLTKLIEKRRLNAAKDLILAHGVECAPLVLGKPEDYRRVGNSRYGGVPDLPPALPWPMSDGKYVNFLMQVNLKELPTIANNPLPDEGMLYFFIEADDECTEVVGEVHFYDGDSSLLTRTDSPPNRELVHLEHYYDLNPHKITPRLGIDLPNYGSDLFWKIDEAVSQTGIADGGDRFFKLIDDALGKSGKNAVVGQLLGYSSEINGDMRENAYLAYSGKRDKIYDEYRDRHEKKVQAAAKEWMLLWRIDSDFDVGVNIWDAGSFYIMIRQEDLKRQDFSKVYIEIETS